MFMVLTLDSVRGLVPRAGDLVALVGLAVLFLPEVVPAVPRTTVVTTVAPDPL